MGQVNLTAIPRVVGVPEAEQCFSATLILLHLSAQALETPRGLGGAYATQANISLKPVIVVLIY